METSRVGKALWLVAVAVLLCSCQESIRYSWKEQVPPAASVQDVKVVQVMDFKSQVKYESGMFTGQTQADQSFGSMVATQLGERIQQSERVKVAPAGTDLKKLLDSRDVMDALVNDGVMKPEVREKVQKISGADAIIVGEVSCSAKKDETNISTPYGSFPVKTISATAGVNFRMYSLKSGSTLLSKSLSKNKSGLGWGTTSDQAIQPLVSQCVDEFCQGLFGGTVMHAGKMFADTPELKAIIQPLEAGVSVDKVVEKLDAYAKAHPESADALFDLGAAAYSKGDKKGADNMIQEAMMKPGADAKAYKSAYDEMMAGVAIRRSLEVRNSGRSFGVTISGISFRDFKEFQKRLQATDGIKLVSDGPVKNNVVNFGVRTLFVREDLVDALCKQLPGAVPSVKGNNITLSIPEK